MGGGWEGGHNIIVPRVREKAQAEMMRKRTRGSRVEIVVDGARHHKVEVAVAAAAACCCIRCGRRCSCSSLVLPSLAL